MLGQANVNGTWMRRCAAGALLAGYLCAGCGNSCDDLQAVCFYCDDPNQKGSCEESVDRGDQELCDLDMTAYCGICGRRGSFVAEACK